MYYFMYVSRVVTQYFVFCIMGPTGSDIIVDVAAVSARRGFGLYAGAFDSPRYRLFLFHLKW